MWSEKGALLQRDDFIGILPENWFTWTDKNGQGYAIDFPLRMAVKVLWGPKNQNYPEFRIPREVVIVDFVKIPYTV